MYGLATWGIWFETFSDNENSDERRLATELPCWLLEIIHIFIKAVFIENI